MIGIYCLIHFSIEEKSRKSCYVLQTVKSFYYGVLKISNKIKKK